MAAHRITALSLLFATLPAQQTAPGLDANLPHLAHASAMPEGCVVLRTAVDGSFAWADGKTIPRTEAVAALPNLASPLVLQVDRGARAALVGDLLALCATAKVRVVHFAVALPNGDLGTLALALPTEAVEADCTIRLHRERDGVPFAGLVPLLQRLHRPVGTKPRPQPTFALECPGDATWSQLLAALAAVDAAGIDALVVRCTTAKPGAPLPPADELLAIDLGPTPLVRVPQREPGAPGTGVPATGAPRFAVPPTPSALATAGGLAGGRYGGRRGAADTEDAEQVRRREALDKGLAWLAKHSRADGSWCDDAGHADVEATALAMLAMLGKGASLQTAEVARAAGWLLAGQGDDGCLAAPGPGQVRRHAVATWALAEASALSSSGTLLRGAVQDALDWLVAARAADGGWNDGAPATASDTISTAWSCAALTSGRFFDFTVPPTAAELQTFFDRVAEPDGRHRLRETGAPSDAALLTTSTAGALYGRYLLGQSPQTTPIMLATVDRLLASHEGYDPLVSYWGTFAMFQTGGEAWQTWSTKAMQEITDTQHHQGEFADSWNPAPGSSRAVATALRVLALSAYYRYARMVR